RFPPEITRHQGLNDFAPNVFRKTSANDRRRDMPTAKAGQASLLLLCLDQGLRRVGDFLGGDFDLNLAPGAVGCLSGAHGKPFSERTDGSKQAQVETGRARSPSRAWPFPFKP